MIRQSEGKPFVSINIKDPVTFKPVVNGAKLYELGLAPNPKSKYKTGKTSKSYCEQYAVHFNAILIFRTMDFAQMEKTVFSLMILIPFLMRKMVRFLHQQRN